MPSLAPYAAPGLMIADQLRRAPLFATLPTDRMECLAALREGALFDVPARVEIVSPGDRPALIVATSGGLVEPASGREWPAGSYLGAAEILAGRAFASAILTMAPSLLYRLAGDRLALFLARCPATAKRLLADLAGDDAPFPDRFAPVDRAAGHAERRDGGKND